MPYDLTYEKSWKFAIGDDTTHGGFFNKPLERGEEYVIFQRALTQDNGVSNMNQFSNLSQIYREIII